MHTVVHLTSATCLTISGTWRYSHIMSNVNFFFSIIENSHNKSVLCFKYTHIVSNGTLKILLRHYHDIGFTYVLGPSKQQK